MTPRWWRPAPAAGMLLAMIAARPAAAQVGPGPGPPPPGCAAEVAAPGPAPAPLTPTPPPPCTCGDRRGLGRLRWHLTRCRRKHQAEWLGYPEEFNEWQLGRSLYANSQAQVANGTAARMVFYDMDFEGDGAQLNLRGRDKLVQVASLLPTTFFPVVIERTPRSPGLDQARRRAMLDQLAAGPFPVPPERVVIGPPIAEGRRGAEAIIVERNRLGIVAAGGGLGGSGAGTGVGPGSFDASGLTGSAITPGVR